ncbi:MAG: hypothetical protein IH823_04515, partial [Candidatus Dadabacteria bacterium]|nr:hypothetical protein [Candidatus Dadabacteria bacterium]
WLGTSRDDRFIYSGNNKAFSVIDRQTNEVIFAVDSLRVLELAADPLIGGAYVAFQHTDSLPGTDGIFHYNSTSNTIDKTYELVYGSYQSGMNPSDMAISHDGKHLFLSNRGNGISYLHVLDLESGEQVALEPVTGAANLAVTFDDRYVYITDPGVHLLLELVPSGILRRYSIASKSIEQYLDFKTYEISEYFNTWPETDLIALTYGSEIGVISSWVEGANIMVWDLAARKLQGTVGLGRDMQTQLVRAIALGPNSAS